MIVVHSRSASDPSQVLQDLASTDLAGEPTLPDLFDFLSQPTASIQVASSSLVCKLNGNFLYAPHVELELLQGRQTLEHLFVLLDRRVPQETRLVGSACVPSHRNPELSTPMSSVQVTDRVFVRVFQVSGRHEFPNGSQHAKNLAKWFRLHDQQLGLVSGFKYLYLHNSQPLQLDEIFQGKECKRDEASRWVAHVTPQLARYLYPRGWTVRDGSAKPPRDACCWMLLAWQGSSARVRHYCDDARRYLNTSCLHPAIFSFSLEPTA